MTTVDPNIDIGIPAAQREDIALGLSRLLADTYTLYLKTHNYHWNVTGPMFQTEMYCGDEADAQERRVLAILQAAESWRVEGDTLTITAPDGMLVYGKQAGE